MTPIDKEWAEYGVTTIGRERVGDGVTSIGGGRTRQRNDAVAERSAPDASPREPLRSPI